MAIPSETFKVSVLVDYKTKVLGQQYAELHNIDDFAKETTPCRTFCFLHEILPLIKNNLIKGGDLDNAIVIYDQLIQQAELDQLADLMGVDRKKIDKSGYILNKPLSYPNEPARHKLLDVIGDIALVGKFIKGKIIAIRPGHRVNNLFARNIIQQMKAEQVEELEVF